MISKIEIDAPVGHEPLDWRSESIERPRRMQSRSRATRILVTEESKRLAGGNVETVRRILGFSQAFAAALVLCLGGGSGALADPPAGTETGASATPSSGDAEKSLPQQSFFSSLKQAFNKDFDHEVVRGHFDLGSPPNSHRYYCLADAKTGKREPNGVLAKTVVLADGRTGIKDGSVSLYSCDTAEKQGMLVTAEYISGVGDAGVTSSSPPAPPAPTVPTAPTAAMPAAAPALASTSPDNVDVAGVRLGMSPDEVRAILKSKKLSNYYESTDVLAHFDPVQGVPQPRATGRFVNVIASWTPPPSPEGDARSEDGESYEVMFTPVPGRERAMAIIHSVGYSPANAVRETALDSGLVKKYGGFAAANELPVSPTWRFQSDGNVQVGDPCNRRGIFGGLSGLNVGSATRQNLALKTTPDEFRFQMERCGMAIVTEDHSAANGAAPREDRMVMRFTVTAYSPSIGLEGAAAATQLIQSAGVPVTRASAVRPKDSAAPNL